MNPVTLVSTVVHRNREVHPANCFPLINPYATTKPEKIPTKLMSTCAIVKISRIMFLVPPLQKSNGLVSVINSKKKTSSRKRPGRDPGERPGCRGGNCDAAVAARTEASGHCGCRSAFEEGEQ